MSASYKRALSAAAVLTLLTASCASPDSEDPAPSEPPAEPTLVVPEPTPAPPQSQCLTASAVAPATSLADSPAPTDPVEPIEPTVENLGPGSQAFPVTASGVVGDTHYVVSRHLSFSPAVIAGFDMNEETITFEEAVEIDGEASTGTWGATVSGEDFYVGMSFEDEKRSAILRLDHSTGELTEVGDTAPARLIWDMDTAPDGTIYASTSRQNNAGLWEFDPETEETEFLEELEDQSRQDARSIAATEDTVYIGLGNAEADLIAFDRDSEDQESIIPEDLAEADYVYALDASEDLIAVGTSSPGVIALVDADDPSTYSATTMPSGTVQEIVLVDETAYFTSGGRLWSFEAGDDNATELAEVDPPGGQTRGIYHSDGTLQGTGSLGYVWSYDLGSGEVSTSSIVEASENNSDNDDDSSSQLQRAEPAQSLAASEGAVFTGGHFSLGTRSNASDELSQNPVPGEPKASVIDGDSMYLAMYSSGELVEYSTTEGEYRTLAEAPQGHNRPRDLHLDHRSHQLLMAVQNDTGSGGSLVIYDQEAEESTTLEPFETEAPSAVTSAHGVAFLAGSSGMQGENGDAVIAAIDTDTEETLWEIEPVEGSDTITGLVELNGDLYGITVEGSLFRVNIETQEAESVEADLGPGDLLVHLGGVFGATEDELFALDTEELETHTLVDDLDAEWFTWPSLTSDGCSLYTMEGDEVIRLSLDQPPETPAGIFNSAR